jgi:glycosyltransferase involved in cell wall biosynthesis
VRILLASNYFHPEHPGGIETVAHNLVTGYRAAGHDVRWVASDCGVGAHRGHPDDVPLAALNLTERWLGVPYPVAAPWSGRRLAAAAAWCDVVHLHDCLYVANVALFAMARRLGRPVLLTQHIGAVPYRNPAVRAVMAAAYRTVGRRLLSRADRVTFVSPVVRDWFRSSVPFRADPAVVPNGVDTALFRPAGPGERADLRRRLGLTPGTPVLLFVGRFVEKKGLHLLRRVAERRPGWSWLLVGGGPGAGPAGWGLANVRARSWTGHEELRDLYAAADLLVLPSVGEGLPMVVLEALACGTPVLTTAETAAGAGEGASLLATAERTAEAIEAAAAELLLTVTPEHRAALAERAAGRWDWRGVTGRYLDLVASLGTAR